MNEIATAKAVLSSQVKCTTQHKIHKTMNTHTTTSVVKRPTSYFKSRLSGLTFSFFTYVGVLEFFNHGCLSCHLKIKIMQHLEYKNIVY